MMDPHAEIEKFQYGRPMTAAWVWNSLK